MGEYVLGYRSADGEVEHEHLNGVPWWEAPVPRRWHRCWAQTRGQIDRFNRVERCACGAIRQWDTGGPWLHKNERRRK